MSEMVRIFCKLKDVTKENAEAKPEYSENPIIALREIQKRAKELSKEQSNG